jgi:hypothetical protein
MAAPLDPLKEFRGRAWRVKRLGLAVTLGLPKAFQTHVVIVNNLDAVVDTRTLMDSSSVELADALRTLAPRAWETPAMLGLGLSLLGAPPVAAVLLGAAGAVGGGWAAGFHGWRTAPPSQDSAAKVLGVLPVALLGMAIGALMGMGTGAFVVIPLGFAATQFLAPRVQRQALENLYKRMATEHNAAVAAELGLFPAALEEEYFPAGV